MFACLTICVSLLTAGCGRTAVAKPKPMPFLLVFCDRSGSVDEPEWRWHAGAIKVILDEFGYDKQISTKVFLFGNTLGMAYDGHPASWEEIGPALDQYVKSGKTLPGEGTYGKLVFEQVEMLAKINPGHPVFVAVFTDLLFNDVDASRAAFRRVLALDNVKTLVFGPVVDDPVKRQQFTARLLPGPQPEERVILGTKLDLQPELRQAAARFKESSVPDTE